MTKKDNNNQTNPSSPIWWLVSAIASVFIGSKLVSGMETAPAVLISLSIFLVLGWALQKIFGANAPVVDETKVVAKAAAAKKPAAKAAAKKPAAKTAAAKKPAAKQQQLRSQRLKQQQPRSQRLKSQKNQLLKNSNIVLIKK
ncbi:hypothetical protein N9E53_02405 [Amylibacter sp.]|nr:hypothetical protein [Amylibacter sp.]